MLGTRKPMMLLLLALLGAIVVTTTTGQNVAPLMQNPEMVDRQLRCVLKKGPCDFIGRTIQRMLPEAINNDCRRCSLQQKMAADQIMAYMQENRPGELAQIQQMYSARG